MLAQLEYHRNRDRNENGCRSVGLCFGGSYVSTSCYDLIGKLFLFICLFACF